MKSSYWFYFFRFLCKVFFVLFYRRRVYGADPKKCPGAALVVANHASFLDPPFVGCSWPEPMYFLARNTLFSKRAMSWLLSVSHSIPIESGTQNVSMVRVVKSLTSEGKKVLIFPEGRRSHNGKIEISKSGLGLLALQCGCPLIPTYVHGTFKAWNRSSRFPKLFMTLACVFGKPIDVTKFQSEDKKKLQKDITLFVMEEIKKLQEWYINGAHGEVP